MTAGKSGKIPPDILKKYIDLPEDSVPTGQPDKYERNQYFFHPDHLGNKSFVTDASGEVSQHTEYLSFGEIMVDNRPVNDKNPYLYNGKELDEETRLYYYGARYYDAQSTRFHGVDPKAEKFIAQSAFVYAANNPIKLLDKNGEGPEPSPLSFSFNLRFNFGVSRNGFRGYFIGGAAIGYTKKHGGVQVGMNTGANFYGGGLGHQGKGFKADYHATAAATVGEGEGENMPMINIHSESSSALSNSFKNSFSISTSVNHNTSSGITQQIGNMTLQIGGLDIGLTEDFSGYAKLGIADGQDRGWSGSITAQYGKGSNIFSLSYDAFTAQTDIKGRQDIVIDGVRYDRPSFKSPLNNAQLRFGFSNNNVNSSLKISGLPLLKAQDFIHKKQDFHLIKAVQPIEISVNGGL